MRIRVSIGVSVAVIASVLVAASQPAAAGPAHAAQAPEYEVPKPPALAYLSPFPIVRLAGRLTTTGARITLLRVKSPAGSVVTVKCRGGRRLGCPFRSLNRLSPYSGFVRYRKIERRLRAGALIEVFARDGHTIGKYTSFKIRKRKLPHRNDLCVLPGARKPVECP